MILEKNEKISISQIAKEIGISIRKVKENITKLKESRHIERRGSTRDGLWIVKKQGE